jgi:hypothetical protein
LSLYLTIMMVVLRAIPKVLAIVLTTKFRLALKEKFVLKIR